MRLTSDRHFCGSAAGPRRILSFCRFRLPADTEWNRRDCPLIDCLSIISHRIVLLASQSYLSILIHHVSPSHLLDLNLRAQEILGCRFPVFDCDGGFRPTAAVLPKVSLASRRLRCVPPTVKSTGTPPIDRLIHVPRKELRELLSHFQPGECSDDPNL